MKELSTKEKAKRYDEAIQRANELNYVSDKDSLQRKTVEHLFPELAESEDERIRNEIISAIKEDWSGRTDWIAWLEKQGEQQKPIKEHDICDTCDEKASCVSPCPTKLIEEEKPADMVDQHSLPVSDDSSLPTFDESIYHPCTEEVYEQNAWSEEDEYQINTILHGLDLKRELYKKEGNKVEEERYNTQYNWLKSIKDRIQPQPKQEWSKEDEEHIKRIIEHFEGRKKDLKTQWVAELHNKEINWLKSLRPQKQWKPNDLPHWKKSTLPNDNTTGFNSDYFCHKGYNINYKELFEKLPKDD